MLDRDFEVVTVIFDRKAVFFEFTAHLPALCAEAHTVDLDLPRFTLGRHMVYVLCGLCVISPFG